MDTFDYSTVGAVMPPIDWPDDMQDVAPQFPVSLYESGFYSKPDDTAFKRVCKLVARTPRMVTVAELADLVGNEPSYSWCAGIFDLSLTNGRKVGAAWLHQHFFPIDVDHDPDETVIFTWRMFLERCAEYNIKPCFIYSTFSARGEERYRVVFVTTTVVDQEPIRDIINRMLLEMFPEADQKTKDAARVVTGGRRLLYIDEAARLDLHALVRGIHERFHRVWRGNYAREIKRFAKQLGLAVTPKNLLDIEFDHPDDRPESEVTGRVRSSGEAPVLQDPEESVMKMRWDYNTCLLSHHRIIKGSEVTFKRQTDQARALDRHQETGDPSSEDWRVLNNPNLPRLTANCPIYGALEADERRFNHEERYAIMKNLALLKGGLARFEKLIKASRHKYNWSDIESQISIVKKERPNPVSYRRAFPEVSTGYPTMWHAAQPDYGNVVILKPPVARSYEEAYAEFSTKFTEVMESTTPGVYVMRAMPGFAKTSLALQLRERVTIAVPRHNLIEEHEARLTQNGIAPVVQPKLPLDCLADDIRAEIEELYARGCYRQATERLRALDAAGLHPMITEYVKRTDDLKDLSVDDVFLATHVHVVSAGTVHETIIVDEDIMDTLLPIRSVRLRDVARLRDSLSAALERRGDDMPKRETELWSTVERILRWCSEVVEAAATSEEVVVEPVSIRSGVRHRLERYVAKSTLKTNIFHAMQSAFMIATVVKGVKYLNALVVNDLPKDKKIIVLSATADEWLHRKLFGDRLKMFYDVGPVEATGSIIQYHDTNTSRAGIARSPGWRGHLDEVHPDIDRITFKDHKEALGGHPDLHLGATTGLNTLAGKDIVVVGTPHQNISKYRLWAMALGHRPTDLTMYTQPVERNGLRFWFFTYRDEYLRNIHLHLVESELIQAAGRARHLHNPVIVTVYSDYPVPGAEYRKVGPEVLSRLKEAKVEEVEMSLAA